MGSSRILEELGQIASKVQSEFAEERRVLSFNEYLELFADNPVRYSRDAASYTRDMFDFYGCEESKRPWGTSTRAVRGHSPPPVRRVAKGRRRAV